ncbi:hypothetical protein [Oceanobacillus damuensis]|nr:hypothetical protein [Oceanobacillus damuensis]
MSERKTQELDKLMKNALEGLKDLSREEEEGYRKFWSEIKVV